MTLDDVHDHFDNLDINKATGLDGIAPYFLKISKTSTAPVVLTLCNLSIKTGIYPDMWKKAKLIPLYKSDSQLDTGNYRPISILAVVSKILERHVSFHIHITLLLTIFFLAANMVLGLIILAKPIILITVF